ncbi:hypothetical protein V1512DRAFT_207785 [Lipomyces arxii]|uniref:uncharacterized protein n=1 Tax=Lipomyces arxii TaxID=56418 RepID=UPI0034CF370F
MDRRAACYESLKQYDKAYADAIAIIKMYPRSAQGYLRAGKVSQLMGQLNRAHRIYQAGLARIGQDSKHVLILVEMRDAVVCRIARAGTELPAPRVDMMHLLPPEITELILLQIPFRDRVKLQGVCKTWWTYIQSQPRLWADADFRKCNRQRKVSMSVLNKALVRTRGMLSELYLYNVELFDATTFTKTLVSAGKGGNFKVLQFDPAYDFLIPDNKLLVDVLRNLKVLNVGAKATDKVFNMISTGSLPNLKVLNLYGPATPIVQRQPHVCSIGNLMPYQQPTKIESLTIDCTGRAQMGKLSAAEFWPFMQNFPELINLTLLNFYVSERLCAQFNETNPKLKTVDLSFSRMEVPPVYGPGLEKLALRDSDIAPETVISSSTGMVMYSHSRRPAVPNEFTSLRHLDLSRCKRLTGARLMSTLVRCDPAVLVRLELESCAMLTKADMQHVVRTCANLQVLNLFQCVWVDDHVMLLLNSLKQLIYLDVSATNVTFAGIVMMFVGNGRDTNNKLIPIMKLVERMTAMASTNDIRLKELIIDNCFKISEQSVDWIKTLGVNVYHDVTDTYEIDRRRTSNFVPGSLHM